MSELEVVMLAEVEGLLAGGSASTAGRPDAEAEHLWLLALEREQIVAVAYREESVAGRVDDLAVSDELRAVVRQTLVWIWKDEELHAEFLRGILLQRGGVASSMVVYGRQLQGALSGWVTATEHHRDPQHAPLRTGAAGVLVAVAGMTGRIPKVMQRELRFQTFRRYCELNVVLEMTAELAYRRLVELAANDDEREIFARIRDDEQRHTDAFRVLAAALDDDGRLVDGRTEAEVIAELAAISEWFLPAPMRTTVASDARTRTFGSGATGRRRQRTHRRRQARGVGGLPHPRRARGARGRRASRGHPGVVHARLRPRRPVQRQRPGAGGGRGRVTCTGTASTTSPCSRRPPSTATCSPTVRWPRWRATSDSCRRSTAWSTSGATCGRSASSEGLVQEAISATWVDADVRIVMPKLRTDPTEFAHLSLSTLEGTTGPIDETFYASRQVDFRTATMMVLDVAPPDFAVVDAWAPVADGPFGVMGCRRPADVRHVYAGADVLAVDEAVLADLGIGDPRQAPIVRRTHHWFGLPVQARDGRRRPARASPPSCAARTRRRRCGRWARCRIRSTST